MIVLRAATRIPLTVIAAVLLADLVTQTGVVLVVVPALFVVVAPPGASHLPWTIGALTFSITLIAALAALSARETFRAWR